MFLEDEMQTPPQIEFQNLSPTEAVRDAIERHVDGLEQRWGRVTACRVVVKGPSQRHQTGGLYDIHIRLALPDGREVNVERTAPADERRADLNFAINDAFKRARETADGREIYFHRNSVLNGGFARLAVGSHVTFAEELGEKGAQASTVRLLGKHALR
jgi:cold shock CspA family protein/ribosome-associated translation inhibitor RaiA